MTIEAQHELSKISVDGECTYYSLKVPKGFDVKRLKVNSRKFQKIPKNSGQFKNLKKNQ